MRRRAQFLGMILLWALGDSIADAADTGWSLYVVGSLISLISIFGILHLSYLSGFRDGIDSVPLVGAGLASGDDRAFDPGHRWNPDLGAWEKRT